VGKAGLDEAASEVAIREAQLKVRLAELEEARTRLDHAARVTAVAPKIPEPVQVPAPPLPPVISVVGPTPAADSAQRLQRVEKALAELLKEVESLRKELKKPSDPKAR
jgi:hypothetical protein